VESSPETQQQEAQQQEVKRRRRVALATGFGLALVSIRGVLQLSLSQTQRYETRGCRSLTNADIAEVAGLDFAAITNGSGRGCDRRLPQPAW
jgi:hypothetical protein